VSYAGSVLFDVFANLDAVPWFKRPDMDMQVAEVCKQSGFLAGPNCPLTTEWVSKRGLESDVCAYHHLLQLDASGNYRVHSNCEDINSIQSVAWFSLPPVMEWYYKRKNADYKSMPPFRRDCQDRNTTALDFIYPKSGSRLYRAVSMEGALQEIVFKIAHRNPDAEVFWYLDDKFIGSTQRFHELPIDVPEGRHVVTVVDEMGNDAQVVVWLE
jgi:penicillin-binding protein 1C